MQGDDSGRGAGGSRAPRRDDGAEGDRRGHEASHVSDRASIEAALAALLARHPEAVVSAVGADGIRVPMPESVPVGDHPVAEGSSALDMVTLECRGLVINTWERALEIGYANAPVRLAAQPDRLVRLHIFDARERHGVCIGVYTSAEVGDSEVTTIARAAPSRSPRFARARKSELAVLLEVDDAFTQILGWAHEVLGRRTLELIHPDDQALAMDNWMDLLAASGPGRRVRLRHQNREGSWIWMEVTNHNCLEDPEQRCVVAEMVDVSEEMAAHEMLRAREQLLDRLAEALPVGLVQVDSERRVVYTNDRLHTILGLGRADRVDEQLATVDREDRQLVADAFRIVLEDGLHSDVEVRVRPFGEWEKEPRYCSLSLRTLTDEAGRVTGAIACLTDVTENTRAREELRTRATFDLVTSCHNRESTMAQLATMLETDHPRGNPAVLFVDLDRFKDVNDTLGHAAGDEFLSVVGERLQGCVRSHDVVGRVGGDEFVVLCHGVSAPEQAMRLAWRLAEALHHDVRLSKAVVPSRASIGVAWSSSRHVTAEELVARADVAMYQSKRAGAGEPVLFDESMRDGTNVARFSAPSSSGTGPGSTEADPPAPR